MNRSSTGITMNKPTTNAPQSILLASIDAYDTASHVRPRGADLLRIVAFRVTVGALALGVIMVDAPNAAGQTRAEAQSPVTKINAEAAASNITVEWLRPNVAMLSGSGGNIGVVIGPEGKLMIDAGIGVSHVKLARAIEQLGPGPIKYVINTHWHWDHTDGNEWLHEAGATLIAHENTVKRLLEAVRVEDWSFTFQPAPTGARPTRVVKSKDSLRFANDTAIMQYYGLSHTDSDISVYLEKADVLFTGDTFWNGVYPFIDWNTGGSIDGMIRAANANIARASDKTVVVSGHGPAGNRASLVEYRDMLVGIRNNVAQLKRQGKSLDEVIAAKPTAAYDAKWGKFVIDPAFFTRLVYRGV